MVTHYGMLYYILVRFNILKKGELIYGAEIGVRHGDTAEYLLSRSNNCLHLTLVDPYVAYMDVGYQFTQAEQDEICAKMEKRLSKYKSFYEFHQNYSIPVAKSYDNESFDFVFIDAEHTYESCKADIEAWYPKVKSTGLLCGHDYSMEGVKLAVRDTFQEACKGILAWTLPESDIWMMFKV